KQRVAIARLFLKDSPVFILDDPLSAVDAKTEEEILASIKEYYGKKTVIIVSHRLSVIRNCDNIVYLENGRIIEQGNHRELLELGGAYSGIWREEQIRQEIERY
ncbi:MAG: ABC transporter ATP-binding protein, partial [Desulfuromonadales bacterium]|nr:ABC transporter ATP-binding protein [Desulfuromonadales bacterium]